MHVPICRPLNWSSKWKTKKRKELQEIQFSWFKLGLSVMFQMYYFVSCFLHDWSITQLPSSEPAEEMLHYPSNSSSHNSNGRYHSLSDYYILDIILDVSYLLFSQGHSFQLYDMFATEPDSAEEVCLGLHTRKIIFWISKRMIFMISCLYIATLAVMLYIAT